MLVEGQTFVTTDDGKVHATDTIVHEGGLWLVPYWLDTPYPNMQKPVRIIRLDTLPHQSLGDISGTGVPAYILRDPMPRSVFDGIARSLSGQQYDVQEGPNLTVRR